MARHYVLHIGDTHLHQDARQADRLSSLAQIVAYARARAEAQALAAIVWPGDLYHARSTVDDRNALVGIVQQLAELAPVVVCYGNHDQPGDLHVLERLRAPWPIVVVDAPRTVHVVGATAQALAIAMLPYPHRAGLVAAGVEHQALGQAAEQALDVLLMTMAHELGAAAAAGVAPMFAAHITVGGAISSTGQPQIGREIELPPALLDRLPANCAVAGNHIHKHQHVGRLVYAGSIARMDYGEHEPKGVVEWAWDTDTRTWTWTFVPLDVPRQVLVEGRLTRDGFAVATVDGEPADALPPELVTGADVRVRYAFLHAEADVLQIAHIHALVAGCRSLKLDPIAIREHSVRAPEIAQAETLEAKVRAYAQRAGIPITDGLLAKVSALQSLDTTDVLDLVREGLAAITTAAESTEVAA